MVGHFGRTIKNLGNQGPISRVTSLDPAKPWFDLSEASNKVSKDDAELVDVVHTNSGFLLDVSKGCVILFANIALLWESLCLQLLGFLRKKITKFEQNISNIRIFFIQFRVGCL